MNDLLASPAGISTTAGTVRSADGTQIAYRRLGDGPPVVVCHGAFAAAEDWMPFATALASTRSVYLYDRRGRGDSPYLSSDFAVDAEVDDLAAVVRLAGQETAIVGHSFGGGCALSFAAREGLATPVVVYEPRHSINAPASGGQLAFVQRLAAEGDRDRAVRAICGDVLGLPAPAVDGFANSPVWERMLATVGAFGYELRFLDSLTWQPGDLDGFTGPCWELVGELTPALPGEREGSLRSVVPNVRTRTVPGQGHFAYLFDPVLLAGLVEDCLNAWAPVTEPPAAAGYER